MKLNYWIIVVVTALMLFLSVPGITQIIPYSIFRSSESSSIETLIAQSNSAREDNLDILYFGYLRDVYPFSYEDESGQFKGYCRKLINDLEKKYFNIEPIEIEVDERFQKSLKRIIEGSERDVVLAGECAPNTITQARINKIEQKKIAGEFSKPFLTTGTKLLIKQENLDSFYQETPLKEEKIGVLGKTTTKDVIENVYHSSKIISDFQNRKEALEALEKGDIATYASDEIILQGILERGILDPNSYSIVPLFEKLSYNEFGLVVYNNDKLLESINYWINSKEGKEAKAEVEQLVKNNQFKKILEFLKIKFPKIPWLFLSLVVILTTLIVSHPLFLFFLFKIIPSKKTEIVLDKLRKFQNRSRNTNPAVIVSNIIFNKIFYTTVYLATNEKIGTVSIRSGDSSQGGNLSIVTAQIQKLLEELKKTYPTDTNTEIAEKAIEHIENDPTLKEKLINAFREGGLEAFGKILDNPVGAFIVGAIKGWQET